MINIKERFLELTSSRTPHGSENKVIELIPELNFNKDEFGNYFIIIKKSDDTFSNTMFTCHLDTIDRTPYYSQNYRRWDTDNHEWVYDSSNSTPDDKSIKHVIDGDFIKTDGNTNLGADDKAGLVIMLNMISENVPGLYYFFVGEESGCIGSSNLSREFQKKVNNNELPNVNKCVSFDRRGYDSVITRQSASDCCSDEFAKDLCNKLNDYGFWFEPDNSGIYTDSAEFTDIIPECTNLSVGYFNEHTISEKQDIDFLELLAVVLTKIDWENLKIVRDNTKSIYYGKKYKYSSNIYNYDDDCRSLYDMYNSNTNSNSNSITNTLNNNTNFNNSLNEDLEKYNESEFDKWYNEQKVKENVV